MDFDVKHWKSIYSPGSSGGNANCKKAAAYKNKCTKHIIANDIKSHKGDIRHLFIEYVVVRHDSNGLQIDFHANNRMDFRLERRRPRGREVTKTEKDRRGPRKKRLHTERR